MSMRGSLCCAYVDENIHYHMSSFSETVALGLMKNEAIEFVKYPFLSRGLRENECEACSSLQHLGLMLNVPPFSLSLCTCCLSKTTVFPNVVFQWEHRSWSHQAELHGICLVSFCVFPPCFYSAWRTFAMWSLFTLYACMHPWSPFQCATSL